MDKEKEKKDTPMVTQYKAIKQNYPDAILFFRLGDFYEMFFEDAVEASRELDLALTQRAGNPMCGVPYHACNSYIQKLLAKGYKVAICEQMSEPKAGKMVEREVIRVITPGTITQELMLDNTKNNYILCAYKNGDTLGLSYTDITTGLFEVEYKEGEVAQLFSDTICRICPSEVIANEEAAQMYENLPVYKLGSFPKVERYYDWAIGWERCDGNLRKQFMDNYLKVYELEDKKAAAISAGALIEYLMETQKRQIKSIKRLFILLQPGYRLNLRSEDKYLSPLFKLIKVIHCFIVFKASPEYSPDQVRIGFIRLLIYSLHRRRYDFFPISFVFCENNYDLFILHLLCSSDRH